MAIALFVVGLLLPALPARVVGGWDGSGAKYIKVAPPAPIFTKSQRQSELAERRRRVAAALSENSILILFSAPSKIYTNDVDYVYRQENNLFYLTGINQNGVTLVISKSGGNVNETLFLPKRNRRTETWNGRMLDNEEAAEISGIPKVVHSQELDSFLDAVAENREYKEEGFSLTGNEEVYLLQGDEREFGKEKEFAERLPAGKVRSAVPVFARLRLIKSPYEIRLMQHSIDITSEALMRSMGMVGRAKWEYEVQAEVEYTFRRRNADFWGYPSIVGCGPNATTLHYVESQGKIGKNELILMDVGAEYSHYTADITRTFPVNGKFTKEQAEIYQIVYDAQEAAAAVLKPGAKFNDASEAANRVIIEGLYRLGLITEKNSSQYRIWYMHGWGHWLGMNVHDVGNYGTTLSEGMIMTNEPGIYIRGDALDSLPATAEWLEFKAKVRPVFEKYKNIGVRIEDDMLITRDGVEWMSKALPRSVRDVEKFMSGARKEMDRYAFLSDAKPEWFENFSADVTADRFMEELSHDRQGVSVRRRFDTKKNSLVYAY